MLVGTGRAQRGHGVGKAQLRQCHHIHVAFGHQHIAKLAQGAARLKQAIEFAALAEDRGFGGVQVLRLFVTQHPAAKANAFALDIADGEHHAVAEAVVAFFLSAVLGLVQDDQATFHQQRVVVLREDAGQTAPALGRVAQAKLFGNFARQAAPLQILDGARRLFEAAFVRITGFLQHAGQGVLLLALLLGAGTVLRAAFFFRDHHAVLTGQVLDGLDEGHARVVHQKADGVAVFAAAEAVVELFGGAHRERR